MYTYINITVKKYGPWTLQVPFDRGKPSVINPFQVRFFVFKGHNAPSYIILSVINMKQMDEFLNINIAFHNRRLSPDTK